MKKVYIAHPLRGAEREKNVEEVTRICQKVVELFPDVLPISPIHAFSFLDDCGEEGEKKALVLCLELLKECDEIWFFGKWVDSAGCRSEYDSARLCYIKCFVYDADGCEQVLSEFPPDNGSRSELARWLLEEVYEPELMPCPFCGGAPILNEEQTFIACDNPDCVINPCLDWEIEPKINTKAEAIAAWNRRYGNE